MSLSQIERSFLIIFLLFIIISPRVSASTNIAVQVRESFERGELIFFHYSVGPEDNETVTYSPFITCEGGYNSSLSWRRTTSTVSDSFAWRRLPEAAACQAKVLLRETGTEKSKDFNVVAADPFVFEPIITCKFGACSSITSDSVFALNRPIEINYLLKNRSVSLPDRFSVNLVYPDGTSSQYDRFPVIFNSDLQGIYTVKVSAYKDEEVANDEISFLVAKVEREGGNIPVHLILYIVLGAVIVVAIYLIWRRKKHKERFRGTKLKP